MPTLPYRGVQIDLGRVIERPETVEKLLPLYASMGYNVLQLYVENAFVFPSHPKLARPHAWTFEQAMRVVEVAQENGMTTIPAIQSMGHCKWVGDHPDYAELDERFEEGKVSTVLCPCHPRTLPLLGDMIRDVAPLATSGIIHMGLDEVFAIGRCSRCAPLRDKIGEGGIYVEHVNRVAEMCRAAGKRPAIWGDMFYFHPDKVPQLGKDILIQDWYYYSFPKAPRVEMFGFPDIDSQTLWKENGLEAWGCPSSLYTGMMPTNLPDEVIENARSWMNYLDGETGTGMMVTQWELSPAAIDLCLPVEAAIGSLLQGSTLSNSELLEEACAKLFDRPNLAPLLEELGSYRLRGHCEMRWMRAASLPELIAFTDAARDLEIASRVEKIAQEIEAISSGARDAEKVFAFVPAARWLAYHLRKRAGVEEAARLVAGLEYSSAGEKLAQLQNEAQSVGEAYRKEWQRNRYEEDAANVPDRMKLEAQWFAEEIEALKAAARGLEYSGALGRAAIGVHVVNTHPAIPLFACAVSSDGEQYEELGKSAIIQFDSAAAQPRSNDEMTFSFSVEKIEDARFLKITPMAAGEFGLRGVSIRHAGQSWSARSVRAEGMVRDMEKMESGGAAQLGHPDPKALFYDLLQAGDSSQIFSVEHGSLTMTFDFNGR